MVIVENTNLFELPVNAIELYYPNPYTKTEAIIHEIKETEIIVIVANVIRDFETGYLSPYRRKETVEIIREHHQKFGVSYKKINLKFPWATGKNK